MRATPSVMRALGPALAAALLLGVPGPSQAQGFYFGEWEWLDPLEWGKHVVPGVESKWQRRDREVAERRAREQADAAFWAEHDRQTREYQRTQALRLGMPPDMGARLDDAYRTGAVRDRSGVELPLTRITPEDLTRAAWLSAYQQHEGRVGRAASWLLGHPAGSVYDKRQGEETSFRPDRLYGALDHRYGGYREPDTYRLDPEERYRPEWLTDRELGGLGIQPGVSYPEGRTQGFATQLEGYFQGLPGGPGLPSALGLPQGVDWAAFDNQLGSRPTPWVEEVNRYRAGLGDPRFPPLPTPGAAGLLETDQGLRAGPAGGSMPAWPRLGPAPGGEAAAPVQAAPVGQAAASPEHGLSGVDQVGAEPGLLGM